MLVEKRLPFGRAGSVFGGWFFEPVGIGQSDLSGCFLATNHPGTPAGTSTRELRGVAVPASFEIAKIRIATPCNLITVAEWMLATAT